MEISEDLAFKLLGVLGSTYIYTLMGSRFESELPSDFKPEKWEGFELEHARESIKAYRELLEEMKGQIVSKD